MHRPFRKHVGELFASAGLSLCHMTLDSCYVKVIIALADNIPIDTQPVSTRGRQVGAGLCLLMLLFVVFFTISHGAADPQRRANAAVEFDIPSALAACNRDAGDTHRLAGRFVLPTPLP